MAALEMALAAKPLIHLAYGIARNSEGSRELPRRRQLLARAQSSIDDGLAQRPIQPFRNAPARSDVEHQSRCVQCGCHRRGELRSSKWPTKRSAKWFLKHTN